MASITIRNLDDSLKAALRSRAAAHGRSMEEEARQLLKQALLRDRSANGLGTAIANLFKESGPPERLRSGAVAQVPNQASFAGLPTTLMTR